MCTDEYGKPIKTRRECIHCGAYLGLQDPGYVCSTCKWIEAEENRLDSNRNKRSRYGIDS
jgi:hypothetical protein